MYRSVAEVFFRLALFLPSPSGRRAGDEGLREGLNFLIVLRAWLVAFKDKNYRSGGPGGKPSPQPSPKRERESKQQRQIEDCRI